MSESVAESVRLQPGDVAPDFTLLDDQSREVSLSSLRGGKVIVYFYPAAMTPGCSKQACDFTASLEQLKERGYTVLGVSPDSPERLAEFRARENLTLTLLSDPSREVLRAYGAFGIKKLYGKQVEGVIRSTFVVDAGGLVEVAQYNVKASGHVDKLRRELNV